MDFRLTRLILIDSYCRNRVVELDLDGHITINGENGAGKTTLLRLLPMFFGESPSRIIRGDAVVEKFGRYYFPSMASYVIFEYQRRTSKVLAVIHPDGQNDGVAYRFIDSEYKPELFVDAGSLVQTKDIHRHLDKRGVYASDRLTLHAYRKVIQNDAGREYKHLAARFSFTGGTGKLTHLERIVTGILQRATTFFDLKRMIVSSLPRTEERFSLRTSKKDLLHWIDEHDAHTAVMAKVPVMADLEHSDQVRRMAELEFSRLHARFKLVHDYFQEQVILAEKAEVKAREDKDETEREYETRIRDLADKKNEAASKADTAKLSIDQMNSQRARYDREEAEAKVAKVVALPTLRGELQLYQKQLGELESEARSLSETFDKMAADANTFAKEEKAKLEAERTQAYQASSKRKDDLSAQHKQNLEAIRRRHETEIEAVAAKLSNLQIQEAGLRERVKNVQGAPEFQEALDMARQTQTDANARLDELRDALPGLNRAFQKIKTAFEEIELQLANGELAVEKEEQELETLLAANNAGEDTLLGFLRRHKPTWVGNIGRLVSEETLLRTDLSPALSDGDDLYGIYIDVEQLDAGRFTSEETLQQEIKLVRNRLERRRAEVAEDRTSLEKKRGELTAAKTAIDSQEAAISVARNAKVAADQKVEAAKKRLAESKRSAEIKAQEELKTCQQLRGQAEEAVTATKRDHREELQQVETGHAQSVGEVNTECDVRLRAIDQKRDSIDRDLKARLADIEESREECLRNKGIDTSVLKPIRDKILSLQGSIEEAEGLASYVAQYQAWCESIWSQKPAKLQEWQELDADAKRLKREHGDLLKERHTVREQKEKSIAEIGKLIDRLFATQKQAQAQLSFLSHCPLDQETLDAGYNPDLTIEALSKDRRKWQEILDEHREKIRVGVEDICRQMSQYPGTGPEKAYLEALRDIGTPRAGKEHLWIEVLRNWFNLDQATNERNILQLGRTTAQSISAFWKSLNDLKTNVENFSNDLRANLEQGKIFDTIADVSTKIECHTDTQDYWEAVKNLHYEYDAWHTRGESALPPPSFISAAKEVAKVLSEETGLVADPVDLISLKITADVNGKGAKTASNEHELANMSSNGLSYIILCVVLIGFVNRIRKKDPVVVPFVVDELKDLSYHNAKTLLELLSRNNITMVSAFPDVDMDLAELFARNYKILPGREVGLVDLDEGEQEEGSEEEAAHV